jgi:plastocyanin
MKIKMTMIGLALAAIGIAVPFTLTACGGGTSTSGGSSSSTAAGGSAQQAYTLEVLNGKLATKYGILGPDGRGHDSFVPAHMRVKAGGPVTFTVYNYDEGPHTFTIDELHINQMIAAHVSDTQPSVTTFTVTFPSTKTYRFYCSLPCDAGQGGWAMTADRKGHGLSQDGFMAGYVSAV